MHISSSSHRPELHLTAETGVLEAPAGAVIVNGAMHVFHQFRPRPTSGSRWAHQYAPVLSYGWDVCDDVLSPEGDEIDILAGSSIPLNHEETHSTSVELFFVSTQGADTTNNPELQGNNVPHNEVGARTFTIQRALIENLEEAVDCSDDPSTIDPHVTRLGPINVDDSAYPVGQLVTPSVIHDDSDPDAPWLMLALSLSGTTDAEIIVLRSLNRQDWTVIGPLEISPEAELPQGRLFAPRIVRMTDSETGDNKHVVVITYPTQDNLVGTTDGEVAGYIVGTLTGASFKADKPLAILDYGYDFTRPRIIQNDPPILIGLVGAHPSEDDQWANCLSSPRNLTLTDGQLFQDIIGAPRAVKNFSNLGLIWTAQLDAHNGSVVVDIINSADQTLATVTYSDKELTLVVPGKQPRTAPLADADSDSITIFVDGPLCEVYADGGATTLTATIAVDRKLKGMEIATTGGARVIGSFSANGQELQMRLAGTGEDD
ncbi:MULTISPECIES: GH32 C-terminal domain-containing protein [Corynebacterium]|uniref:GH32 C-terminal domain-containing protein n=1 Tax=Corynebacterium TaxID=1716 RepID=UPI001CE443A4|nr:MULTISPECIES: GH32 C-terminal domain-containing protein [Corynebacterium]